MILMLELEFGLLQSDCAELLHIAAMCADSVLGVGSNAKFTC